MKILFLIAAVALNGCAWADALAPLVAPADAVRFDPEALDERGMLSPTQPHFAAAQKCSGLTGSYNAIAWYYVPRTSFRVPGNTRASGWWDGKNGIYLSQAGRHSATLIRHEVIHYLRQQPGHPDHFFGPTGVCGSELH